MNTRPLDEVLVKDFDNINDLLCEHRRKLLVKLSADVTILANALNTPAALKHLEKYNNEVNSSYCDDTRSDVSILVAAISKIKDIYYDEKKPYPASEFQRHLDQYERISRCIEQCPKDNFVDANKFENFAEYFNNNYTNSTLAQRGTNLAAYVPKTISNFFAGAPKKDILITEVNKLIEHGRAAISENKAKPSSPSA